MSSLSKFADLKLRCVKTQRVSVGFGMQAFLSMPGKNTRELRGKVADVALEFQAAFPDLLTHFQRHNARRLSPVKGTAMEEYYQALNEKQNPDVDQFSVHVTDPEIPPSCAMGALVGATESIDRVPYAGLTAHVPLDWFEAHPQDWINMVLGWCNRLQPAKGAVGVNPITEFGTSRARYREIWPFLSRYPGMGALHPLFEVNMHPGQIGTVNWLTILNDELVEKLGGRDVLEAQVDDRITLHDWDGGILFQAGAMPELGDRTLGLWPEAYRKVSNATRPIRFEDYRNTPMALMKVPAPLDSYEETLNWVRRFDVEET